MPRGDELVEVAEVDLPGVADRGELGVYLVESREVVGSLDDHRDGARVAEVPANLRGRARLVDGHEHCAGEPGGEVDEGPLVAGLAHEADLVARLDAGSDEALRERDDLVVELTGRHRGPAAVSGGKGEQHQVGRRGDAIDEQVGGVRLRVWGDHCWRGEFDHGSSFGTGRVTPWSGTWATSALGSITL